MINKTVLFILCTLYLIIYDTVFVIIAYLWTNTAFWLAGRPKYSNIIGQLLIYYFRSNVYRINLFTMESCCEITEQNTQCPLWKQYQSSSYSSILLKHCFQFSVIFKSTWAMFIWVDAGIRWQTDTEDSTEVTVRTDTRGGHGLGLWLFHFVKLHSNLQTKLNFSWLEK